ncbi:MAG: Gfo/Idh/MocA family oxidoreductase [Actinobacteria bacterium]|nr:Gfo/Idh/MocA family oxidoreductase [Actinomycetota bacterium]
MVVGLVGCGRWGRHILRDLQELGCDVPVVARSAESKARASEGGASAIVPDIASLPSLDGVVVATTTSTHASVLEVTLALGVPVFVEKPLSNDPEAAARLARDAGNRLFVMDKWRYHPSVLEIAAIVRERRLGAVSGLRTVRVGWDTPHDDVDPVWVLAPHDLAIGLEVMGAAPGPVAATAHWVHGDAMHLSAVLEGDGWWHVVEVSGRSPERRRRVELYCMDGVAVLGGGWDEHVSIFSSANGELREERVATRGELPLKAELRAFVEHLGGGRTPRSSAAEAAAIVAAIAELRRLAGES